MIQPSTKYSAPTWASPNRPRSRSDRQHHRRCQTLQHRPWGRHRPRPRLRHRQPGDGELRELRELRWRRRCPVHRRRHRPRTCPSRRRSRQSSLPHRNSHRSRRKTVPSSPPLIPDCSTWTMPQSTRYSRRWESPRNRIPSRVRHRYPHNPAHRPRWEPRRCPELHSPSRLRNPLHRPLSVSRKPRRRHRLHRHSQLRRSCRHKRHQRRRHHRQWLRPSSLRLVCSTYRIRIWTECSTTSCPIPERRLRRQQHLRRNPRDSNRLSRLPRPLEPRPRDSSKLSRLLLRHRCRLLPSLSRRHRCPRLRRRRCRLLPRLRPWPRSRRPCRYRK